MLWSNSGTVYLGGSEAVSSSSSRGAQIRMKSDTSINSASLGFRYSSNACITSSFSSWARSLSRNGRFPEKKKNKNKKNLREVKVLVKLNHECFEK